MILMDEKEAFVLPGKKASENKIGKKVRNADVESIGNS